MSKIFTDDELRFFRSMDRLVDSIIRARQAQVDWFASTIIPKPLKE